MIEPAPDKTALPLAKNFSTWLWVCVGFGLILRIAWCMHLPATVDALRALPDQLEYLTLAGNWLSTGTLSFVDSRFGQELFAYRTPGYPALIAICGGSIRITRLLQALADAGSILATGVLARRWLTHRASLLAAWIVCLNPLLIYFTGLLLGETLFTSLLMWGMVGLSRKKTAAREQGSGFAFHFTRMPLAHLAGLLCLALAVLVRPSALFLPPILAGIATRRGVRKMLLDGVVAMAIVLAVLLPWAIRNKIQLHQWVWLSTNGGITLYDGFDPAADGSSDQSFVAKMPELAGMNEVQRDQYLRQAAWTAARSDPSRLIMLTIRKIARTWSPIPLSPMSRSSTWNLVVGAVYLIPLFVFAAIGLWVGSLSGAAKVFLITPAIYITVVHGLTVGSLRYRIPADIPLAVVASNGLLRHRSTNRHATLAQ